MKFVLGFEVAESGWADIEIMTIKTLPMVTPNLSIQLFVGELLNSWLVLTKSHGESYLQFHTES